MARKNFLIEGVSGSGKSSVCAELKKLGYTSIDGDNELAYQGDPQTGIKTKGFKHKNHIWDVKKVKLIISSNEDEHAFFCGGSRNFKKFIDLFDRVFILDLDKETLNARLNGRSKKTWGGTEEQRKQILRLHQTEEDIPNIGIKIDATKPLNEVVQNIISHAFQK